MQANIGTTTVDISLYDKVVERVDVGGQHDVNTCTVQVVMSR